MYDVIIIGSGPAGLTAAIYTTRANLKTLVLAGSKWGGQLQLTTDVENFPGFPEGIQGPDLMAAMRKQAEHHGAEILDREYTGGNLAKQGGPFKLKAEDQEFEAKSVIIATGADTKWLGVPGEAEKIGRGVSSCAPCDAPFFRNKKVIVVGGGDSAMEEASVLAVASDVTLIHRGESFRASEIMQKRVKENPKIKIMMNTEIKEILGDQRVERVKLWNNKENRETEMPIDGVFVAIGHIPNTKVFEGIDLDEKGYVKKYDHSKTNIDGVFVAGDVHDYHYRQAITAAGFGCMAALEAQWWLTKNP